MAEVVLPRVLVVTNMYPTTTTPAFGIFVAEQVMSLRRRGLQLDVLFVDGAKGWGEYLRGFGRVRRAVSLGEHDLIHAHYVFSGILALVQRRLPVLLTHHGIEAQRGWTAPLCRWTSQRVNRTIVTSRRVQEALYRSARWSQPPRFEIVPCGVNTELFSPMPEHEARAVLGLPINVPLVLFVGLRRPEKRLDVVETAVSRLRVIKPDVRLIVCDHEPHDRVPLYMNACNVLALASEAEGSPMVVKEAMACNLPIASVDVGDVAEVIGGTPGCFLAAPDADSLAAGLDRALSFGNRTEGRKAIMELSLDAIARRLERIYCEVVDEAGCLTNRRLPTNMPRPGG
jgi:teichuronic acid biosynthesis glycosyltransferase TuaC